MALALATSRYRAKARPEVLPSTCDTPLFPVCLICDLLELGFHSTYAMMMMMVMMIEMMVMMLVVMINEDDDDD